MTWLTGKHTQAEIDGTATGRTFRRDTAWCWDVQPRLEPATEVHHAVLVDGIWVGTWCLLIAIGARERLQGAGLRGDPLEDARIHPAIDRHLRSPRLAALDCCAAQPSAGLLASPSALSGTYAKRACPACKQPRLRR